MHIDDAPDVDKELEDNDRSTERVFQPFPDPDDPNFDNFMQRDVYHIVRVRQIHSRKHMPCCFKYGSRKCRFRFPRKIILETRFDDATGVVHVKRNHRCVNNFNKWFSMMTRANHDIQFLFTKNHSLAIVHYIMKYDRGFCTVSLFDDYAYRGEALANYCLYDYCAQFYKYKRLNGLLFDPSHPQREHYSQFLRKDTVTVPTLLGTNDVRHRLYQNYRSYCTWSC